MARTRPIRLFGDPVLRTVADPVTEVDESLSTLVDDMFATMDDAEGIGLAANQVGVLRRVIVWNADGDRGYLVNPTWTAVGDRTESGSEGCLSIPGVYNDVDRYTDIEVSGFDLDGATVGFAASGLLARVIQHETDHLDGVLFLKRLDPDRRKQSMAELRSMSWFTDGSVPGDKAGSLR